MSSNTSSTSRKGIFREPAAASVALSHTGATAGWRVSIKRVICHVICHVIVYVIMYVIIYVLSS
eukprot:13918-Heterococcus_DN1.PRE.2